MAQASVDGVLIVSTGPTDIVDTDLENSRVVIHNRLGVVYVKLGRDCSSADYTWRLNKDAILNISNSIGPITACTASGAGFLDVTTWG
jgi:hypothetical protein